ncbi:hypothetical protein AAFF_G00250510 [Aldrovandia affinis]|uniref:Uncharacterized protein n=1 Tax=Aldrovandia affinis TaxID=143900 RepID=A0AAD7W359_9TELE|nr:hypothetical protein AAFF_G00250510 [Aldrovandia affinis]
MKSRYLARSLFAIKKCGAQQNILRRSLTVNLPQRPCLLASTPPAPLHPPPNPHPWVASCGRAMMTNPVPRPGPGPRLQVDQLDLGVLAEGGLDDLVAHGTKPRCHGYV